MLLYQHGMDLVLVSQWLGHANLEITLIYARADTVMKRKTIECESVHRNLRVDTGERNPDARVDDTLKRIYNLR